MKLGSLTALTSTLLLLGGCSAFQEGFREGMNQADYTDAIKANFMSQCTADATQRVGADAARKYCDCAFDRISSTIPLDQFVKLDSGEPVRDETTSALKVAVTQCGGSANNL